jgi:peptide/nickel transport system substrate-binding protein
MVYLIIPDPISNAAAFRTKQIDILTVSLPPSQRQDLEKQVKDAQKQTVLGSSAWIAMNTSKPPFSDVRVRQAVALLYNRSAEVQSVYQGEADPMGTALLPYPDALRPKDIPEMAALMKYDVAEAKKLLSAAGFPSGFKTDIVMSPQYLSNPGYGDSLDRFVGDLKAGGIDATARSIEYGVWIASYYRPPYNFDGMLWGPGRYYADPDPYVAYWLHPKGIANQSRVNDPTVAALVEKQATQVNPKERWETLREIQRVEAKNAWYIWRVTPQTTQLLQANVRDYQRHEGYDSHEFWHAWLA